MAEGTAAQADPLPSDDLLRRNPIRLLRDAAHELDPAARDDGRLESVGPKAPEELVDNHEDGVDTEPRQNIEGLLGMQTWYDGPKTDLDASVGYFPGLSDWGRHRLQINSAVKRDLWKDFFVALNLYDTFDSAPPSPDADRNDVGVVTSIGWSF